MAAEVGQQNDTLPGDTCDVTLIQDEDLLRKMWQTTEDFGRKKEIRARMYKLREQRLREFYTTGEVLKDVQSVDPGVAVQSLREETPKRCGTHYRQLVVGELRGEGGNSSNSSSTTTKHYETSSSSTSVSSIHSKRANDTTVAVSETRSTTSTSKLPRLNMTTTHVTETTSVSSNDAKQPSINVVITERQNSNTDSKIMSELQKLDTFLSTTGVDTPTPDTSKGSTFDSNNWTVVSSNSNDKILNDIKQSNARVEEFVFESADNSNPCNKTIITEYHKPGSKDSPEVHSVVKKSESNWSGETGDGGKVTTSSKQVTSYTVQTQQRRISTDLSKDHEAFARSLRSSPERRMYESSSSTRSSSKNSLEASIGRGSPDRFVSSRSPRDSPDKEKTKSPTRSKTSSPTRGSPIRDNLSPSRDKTVYDKSFTTEKQEHVVKSSFNTRTNQRSSVTRQESPTRTSPTRDRPKSPEKATSPSHLTSTTVNSRTTVQTSTTRKQSPTRTSPIRDRPNSPEKATSPTHLTSTTVNSRTTVQTSATRKQSPTRSSPVRDRPSSPEKSVSPSNLGSPHLTSVTSSTAVTKERRKLSSSSIRPGAKRAGTPGASPSTSPTREQPNTSTRNENRQTIDAQNIQRNMSIESLEDTKPFDDISDLSPQAGAVDSMTVDVTTLDSNNTGTIKRKKSPSKQPVDVTIQKSQTDTFYNLDDETDYIRENKIKQLITSHATEHVFEREDEFESMDTHDKKLNETSPFKQPLNVSPKTPSAPFEDVDDDFRRPSSSPEADNKKSPYITTGVDFPPEQKKSPVSTVEKPRSILRNQAHKAQNVVTKPASPLVEPDDQSSRSLTNEPKVSKLELELENAPCENVTDVVKKEEKQHKQTRTSRRRSRDIGTDDDTSGRESSYSPVRDQPAKKQHTAPKFTPDKNGSHASPTRPTKLPVASKKQLPSVASPDRCCSHNHDNDKPWRQNSSITAKDRQSPVPKGHVASNELRQVKSSPTRRRPVSRSPSTSPDRPQVTQSRVERKTTTQKTSQQTTTKIQTPKKSTEPSTRPAQSPSGKRVITERSPSSSRVTGIPSPQHTTSTYAKPSLRPTIKKTAPTTNATTNKKPGTLSNARNVHSKISDDERPPQEFHADETSEDEVACRRHQTAPHVSPTRRVDIIRKTQTTQQTNVTTRTNTQPSKQPQNKTTASRVPRVEPVSQRPASSAYGPKSTQIKSPGFGKTPTTRQENDRSVAKTKVTSSTVTSKTKLLVNNVPLKQNYQPKITRDTGRNVPQTSRLPSTNKPSVYQPQVSTKKTNKPATTPVKHVENAKAPVESEDEESCTFSTEEDETVTELEEVRYSSHTVDDTEDEDFRARVNACGASLKPATTDIVLLRSSRESSPESGLKPPRYADRVSEPETDTDAQRTREVTPLNVVVGSQQITDLDEGAEDVDPSLLSVADRVSRFLTPTTVVTPVERKVPLLCDDSKPSSLDSPSAVRRARQLFETKASAPTEPVPKQTVPDILNRPSVFDDPNRRRFTGSKPEVSPEKTNEIEDNDQTQTTLKSDRVLSNFKETNDDKVNLTKIERKNTAEEYRSNILSKNINMGIINMFEQGQLPNQTPKTPSDTVEKEVPEKPCEQEPKQRRRSSTRTTTIQIVPDEVVNMKEKSGSDKIDERVVNDTEITLRKTQEVTRRDSNNRLSDKPREAVPKRDEPRTNDDSRKQPTQRSPAGKFGVTLRQTNTTVTNTATNTRVTEQRKQSVTDTLNIEEITDIQVLEQMLERATDYDERRRLRAHIREIRRLGSALHTAPQKKPSSSSIRQNKVTEEPTNKTSSATVTTRRTSDTRQSLTRESPSRGSDKPRQSPTRAFDTTRQSPTRAYDPTRQSPTRTFDTTRQSPTRAFDTTRQSPTSTPEKPRESPTRTIDTTRQSPVRSFDTCRQSPTRNQEPPSRKSPTRTIDTTRKSSTNEIQTTRKSSSTEIQTTRKSSTSEIQNKTIETSRQSPARQSPERRLSSPTKEPARKTSASSPRDEEDGNRISSTFIRQASKKFEDIANREENKYATFTRRTSSKKIVQDEEITRRSSKDEDRYATFTRRTSSKKIIETSPPPTERKSSKSELTIELAKPSTTTGNRAPVSSSTSRKPSVPGATPREVNPTDSITSSYGVGPTDESGRPLFGLRALRRSQQQEPGTVVIEQHVTREERSGSVEVKDSSGRPLFGLRALKKEGSPRSCDQSPRVGTVPTTAAEKEDEVSPRQRNMPERAPSSGQLRDLVQKHEQQARDSPNTNSSSAQKPRAKLRDSFITQENRSNAIKTSKEEALSKSTERSNALRALIQKHESITESEQQSKLTRKDSAVTEKTSQVQTPSQRRGSASRRDSEDRSSPATVQSNASPRRGSTSRRDSEDRSSPVTDSTVRRPSDSTPPPEQTRRPGILKKPRDSPERSSLVQNTTSTTVSTASINLRKVDEASVNKIIEETRRSSTSRSPPDGSTSNSLDLESPRAVAEIALRSNSSVLDKCRISPERDGDYDEEKVITDEDGGETRVRRTHREQVDGAGGTKSFTRTSAVTQRTLPHGAEERISSSTVTTVTQRTSSSSDSPNSPVHSIARVGRSGSVKALQQRFQQAAAGGTGTNDAYSPKSRGYQKAGLIFRTNSFQHTNGCGKDLIQGNQSKEGSPRRDDESEGEVSPTTKRRSETTTRTSVSVSLSGSASPSPTKTTKSFLGSETRVTGVQDILSRMKAADTEEVAPGTSEDDKEARSLLNKFLGAQVLLQGMEPLMAAQSTSLVSQVERQRIIGSTSTKEDFQISDDLKDLESIFDEKHLKQLLEASDDYDTRRKIRARLRVVMAENKVTPGSETRECSESVQESSGDGVLNTVRGELLPYIVEQLKTSLERGPAVPVGSVASSSNGGGGNSSSAGGVTSSECSEDCPAFDSGTESGEDPRTPSSQTEIQDEFIQDGSEFSCFIEGLRNSFDSRHGLPSEASPESEDKIANLPPDVIRDVHAALAKLRGSLQLAAIKGEIVDPDRSEALLSLITRLQSSLSKQESGMTPQVNPPWQEESSQTDMGPPPVPAPRKKKPSNRYTVGVSREELDDARKSFDDQNGSSNPMSPVTSQSPGSSRRVSTPAFRPVHFSPMRSPSLTNISNSSAKPFTQLKTNVTPQPKPRQLPGSGFQADNTPPHPNVGLPASANNVSSQEPNSFEKHEAVVAKQRPRAASCSDDPSKNLFTPEQSVQIAVHKAAINKQLSLDEDSRKSSFINRNVQPQVQSTTNFQDTRLPLNSTFYPKNSSKSASAPPTPSSSTGTKDYQIPLPVTRNLNKFENKENLENQPKQLTYSNSASNQSMNSVKNSQDIPKIKLKLDLNLPVASEPTPSSSVIWGSILQSSNKNNDETPGLSSAQKLLQIASKKFDDISPTSSRSSRSEKRKKMKRANTIDIPKPLHMIEVDDSDDDDESSVEDDMIVPVSCSSQNTPKSTLTIPPPAPFIPKTENDRKFLAFLERRSPVGEVKPNPGHPIGVNQWTNRFSNIKTNFESKTGDLKNASQSEKNIKLNLPARKFWSKADDELKCKSQKTGPRISRQTSSNLRKMFEERDNKISGRNVGIVSQETSQRPPWASDEKPIVVVGSLTVSSNNNKQLTGVGGPPRRQLYVSESEVKHPATPKAVPNYEPNYSAKPLSFPTAPLNTSAAFAKIQKLEELQRQQQLQFLQQKQQQQQYCQIQAQKQMAAVDQKQKVPLQNLSNLAKTKELIRGPAPISKFSHAQNSAFRPPEKRTNNIPTAGVPPIVPPAPVMKPAPQFPVANDKFLNDDSNANQTEIMDTPPSENLSRQNSTEAPVMMTAVTRVMAAPISQHATVTNQVKRRDTDFSAPRTSAARNLSSMLQRFSDADEDLDQELSHDALKSPRRMIGLVPSSRSTSDMHDPMFQERFAMQRAIQNNSVASSRGSSIGRYESATSGSPLHVISPRSDPEDQVISMRLQIPLIQTTTTPSPTFYPSEATQYYQAHFNNPPNIISPPAVNNNIQRVQPTLKPDNRTAFKRDLSPKEAASFSPLRKCESWHQLAYQKQRPQSLALPSTTPPTRRSPNIKASSQLFSKQYEARMSLENVEDKQRRVEAYLHQEREMNAKDIKPIPKKNNPPLFRQESIRQFVNDDDLENVDEVFENIFNDAVQRKVEMPKKAINVSTSSYHRNREESSGVRTCSIYQSVSSAPPSSSQGASKHSETSVINTSDSTKRTEVHTKTSSFSSSVTSNSRVSKAAPPSKLQMSPFAKFKQLDEQNSSPSPSTPKTPGGSSAPLFKFTDAALSRSASTVKDKLLYWCQVKTKEYKDLKIENFSTSWSNGLAFCALIHHFCPDAFDYYSLRPEKRRKNFELAFKVAEEKFDIAPLLDVDDMVMMKKPDWKCVFTYVQSIYRRFKDELD